MTTYRLLDGTSGEYRDIDVESMEQAIAAAESWMRDCEWGNDNETIWVSCYVAPLIDGEPNKHAEARVDVTIDPPQPTCVEELEHDWQSPHTIVGGIKENPGVWGHGGGILMHEVCMRCGCERVTDTWAQDPNTGRQGLRSVKYGTASNLDVGNEAPDTPEYAKWLEGCDAVLWYEHTGDGLLRYTYDNRLKLDELPEADAIGTADNTAAAQTWLNQCSAVKSWEEIDDATIEFHYDPNVEVTFVPHFVKFEAVSATEGE